MTTDEVDSDLMKDKSSYDDFNVDDDNFNVEEPKEELESLWGLSPESYSEKMKKRILAKVIEVAILTVLENHYYTFAGKLYKQGKGCPIGLRLSGIVCRIVMDRLVRKIKVIVGKMDWVIYLIILLQYIKL